MSLADLPALRAPPREVGPLPTPGVRDALPVRHPHLPPSRSGRPRVEPDISTLRPARHFYFALTAVERSFGTQPVEVRSKKLSVDLGSYPGGSKGDQRVEAPGTWAHVRWVGKRAGRNASEA